VGSARGGAKIMTISIKESMPALLKLSELDVKIHQLIDKQDEIPQIIQQITSDVKGLQGEIDEKFRQLTHLQGLKKDNEDFIQEKKGWLENREPFLKTLKTNKEYQLALKEASVAKKEISDKEAQLLDIYTKIIDTQKIADETQAKNEPRIADNQNLIAEHQKQLGELDDRVAAERAIRQEISLRIDAHIIETYNKIISRGIPALSLAQAGVCNECSTRLPPQIANMVCVGKDIILCPRCKRILYSEDCLLPQIS
jgi:predicted  nucleic acid-binding Zn-ribbon protein